MALAWELPGARAPSLVPSPGNTVVTFCFSRTRGKVEVFKLGHCSPSSGQGWKGDIWSEQPDFSCKVSSLSVISQDEPVGFQVSLASLQGHSRSILRSLWLTTTHPTTSSRRARASTLTYFTSYILFLKPFCHICQSEIFLIWVLSLKTSFSKVAQPPRCWI